jgi:hypothetical protein
LCDCLRYSSAYFSIGKPTRAPAPSNEAKDYLVVSVTQYLLQNSFGRHFHCRRIIGVASEDMKVTTARSIHMPRDDDRRFKRIIVYPHYGKIDSAVFADRIANARIEGVTVSIIDSSAMHVRVLPMQPLQSRGRTRDHGYRIAFRRERDGDIAQHACSAHDEDVVIVHAL